MSQRIRIKLQSYDHNLVDKSAEKIVKTVRSTGAVVTGPIPLPTRKKIFTVLRSPHVNKKAREQFQLHTHKRLLDIYTSSSRTVDALSKLDLPSGVDVEIKAWRIYSSFRGVFVPPGANFKLFIYPSANFRQRDKAALDQNSKHLKNCASSVRVHMNKPFRVCLLPVLLSLRTRARRAKSNAKKRSAANEGIEVKRPML